MVFLQKQLAEINKQIKVEKVQLEKVNINSHETGLSLEKCQKQNKLEVQGNMNSLESSNTLSNSPSVIGSQLDSRNFSPMDDELRKMPDTSFPHEKCQIKIADLKKLLKKKEECIKLWQDKYKSEVSAYQDFITKQNQQIKGCGETIDL